MSNLKIVVDAAYAIQVPRFRKTAQAVFIPAELLNRGN